MIEDRTWPKSMQLFRSARLWAGAANKHIKTAVPRPRKAS